MGALLNPTGTLFRGSENPKSPATPIPYKGVLVGFAGFRVSGLLILRFVDFAIGVKSQRRMGVVKLVQGHFE